MTTSNLITTCQRLLRVSQRNGRHHISIIYTTIIITESRFSRMNSFVQSRLNTTIRYINPLRGTIKPFRGPFFLGDKGIPLSCPPDISPPFRSDLLHTFSSKEIQTSFLPPSTRCCCCCCFVVSQGHRCGVVVLSCLMFIFFISDLSPVIRVAVRRLGVQPSLMCFVFVDGSNCLPIRVRLCLLCFADWREIDGFRDVVGLTRDIASKAPRPRHAANSRTLPCHFREPPSKSLGICYGVEWCLGENWSKDDSNIFLRI